MLRVKHGFGSTPGREIYRGVCRGGETGARGSVVVHKSVNNLFTKNIAAPHGWDSRAAGEFRCEVQGFDDPVAMVPHRLAATVLLMNTPQLQPAELPGFTIVPK